jgi:hypothetical protein
MLYDDEEDTLEATELLVRDQALTIEGLSQANTELERQRNYAEAVADQRGDALDQLEEGIFTLAGDLRELRNVNLVELDDCITNLVEHALKLAGRG